MSRFTGQRRWSVIAKKQKLAAMTEHAITPDEARTALLAIVLQAGRVFERMSGYDFSTDRFSVVCRNQDGKLEDVTVFGETVAKVVFALRTMVGAKQLKRPSEQIVNAVR